MEELSKNYNDVEKGEVTYTPSYEDKTAPIINIKQRTYKIKVNDKIDFLNDVTASDIQDGDLTDKITSNINELNFKTEGIKKVEYTVSDTAGNVAYETIYVTVKKNNDNVVRIGQIGAFIALFSICILIIKYIRSLNFEKRFSKFTINSSKNKSISLFDNIYLQYLDFEEKLSKFLLKSTFINNRSKKYEKYVTAFNFKSNINFIAKKIIIGFTFILFIILIELLQSRLANGVEMLISFIIGFYALDILYLYKYNKYKKKIETNMMNAITIMNNAFRAGMSIIQAVDLVSKEVNGPISKEFEKISTDIDMGLDIEVAFKRFSSRVKTDEAIYLTSSLSVLNKTGGNIIKVFDSIEKNIFNRRKLENELNSLTSSSKLIMYVLTFVPPVFVIIIGLINREYFEPLYNNILGIILILIMCLIYTTYIIVVRKVLKVRGIK